MQLEVWEEESTPFSTKSFSVNDNVELVVGLLGAATA